MSLNLVSLFKRERRLVKISKNHRVKKSGFMRERVEGNRLVFVRNEEPIDMGVRGRERERGKNRGRSKSQTMRDPIYGCMSSLEYLHMGTR